MGGGLPPALGVSLSLLPPGPPDGVRPFVAHPIVNLVAAAVRLVTAAKATVHTPSTSLQLPPQL